MARRTVAVVAAVVLMVEAVGIALLNWILGLVVEHQDMSLADLDPGAMTIATWVAGGLICLYLLGCGVVLLRMAITDLPPGRFARILLITCAVTHGLLGAFAVGLVGWPAFTFMMVVLGLIVLSLFSYDGERAEAVDGGRKQDGSPVGPAPTTSA
ncbi:hypothetical protein [Streptomyces zagrosensis]|uniref:Integral membrane protein n=1 Tax=Streptomyces zagrosensis TaxID=1042984 RepID=A0A7W9QGA9_9ACTN|nr:hypothetical protein [Streptomyces zagrosensis]MBB5939193.1 hypothetical protein [Streptomyces zagrosensis]